MGIKQYSIPRLMLQKQLMRFGDKAALHLHTVLPDALAAFQHIILLTHVPPFLESAWRLGKPSSPDFLPFFSCIAVGDVLVEFLEDHPDKQMTVLCGHTHGSGIAQILPNLVVDTGSARYGYPRIQKTFEWE
jgi:Icc protein